MDDDEHDSCNPQGVDEDQAFFAIIVSLQSHAEPRLENTMFPPGELGGLMHINGDRDLIYAKLGRGLLRLPSSGISAIIAVFAFPPDVGNGRPAQRLMVDSGCVDRTVDALEVEAVTIFWLNITVIHGRAAQIDSARRPYRGDFRHGKQPVPNGEMRDRSFVTCRRHSPDG